VIVDKPRGASSCNTNTNVATIAGKIENALKNWLAYAFVALLLMTGCQATNPDAGSGYINLSRHVEAFFQSYLANPNGEYFAVSTDGQNYGYSVCHSGRFNCTESGGVVALRACRQRSGSVPCKLYAMGEDIVWQAAGRVPDRIAPKFGSGPIELSARTKRRFQTYLEERDPEYFAVSPDGIYSSYSFCKNSPCLNPGLKALAVSGCVRDSGGQDCRIYAIKREIVWK